MLSRASLILCPLRHPLPPRKRGAGVKFEGEVLATVADDHPQQPYPALVQNLAQLDNLAKGRGNLVHSRSAGYYTAFSAPDQRTAVSTGPRLTVDIIIELPDEPGNPIVLVKRAHAPYGWAIPGGFVDPGERLEEAALREAAEETTLTVRLRDLLYCYSDPQRDPRGHTVSAVFIAEARGRPVGGDDAAAAGVFQVPVWPAPLAFDHAQILADYQAFRTSGTRPSPGPIKA